MSLPPDAAARERALDVTRSCIVKAPAGSGKTSLLVARYLALLAGAERPEEVLAITFTRKATAEMRARILEALAGTAGPAPAGAWGQRLHALAVQVAAQDARMGWQLRDNPQRLSIQTIDALCATLARRLPLLSGLGGALVPREDPLRLYQGAARRTLDLLDDAELGAPVVRTLDHLDGNMASFEALLAEMLARRDQWMRYLRVDDPARRRGELEQGLREVVTAGLAAVRRTIPLEVAPELVALAAHAGERAAALEVEPELAALRGLEALPAADGASLASWKGIAQLLLTAQDGLRKRAVGKVFSAREAPQEHRRMSALLASLADNHRLVSALAAVRKLPAPCYDDAQWATLLDLFQVLKLAVAALRLEFAESGASDFPEQVAAASQALGEEQAPTDLALALDYRVRHLLVDEFQDTSAAHFDIVRKLTAGWAEGDGHTLFLVGDPMQSIYRFREAEVGLFLGCYQGKLDAVSLEAVALSANFRSQGALVQWVNASFPGILPARDDPARAAVAYESSVATREQEAGAAVTVHAGCDEDARAQASRVAATVAAARADTPHASVAILLRTRRQADVIVAALSEHGLCWRGVELAPLFGVPAVQDLHALCSALLHPGNRVSWLAVLRAPWCGLTLDDLEALVGDEPRAPVVALLGRQDLRRRLGADAGARLERVASVLLEAHQRVGRDALWRLATRAWRALGGPACLAGASLDDAHRYLALVAQLEREHGAPDPDELARRARALYAAPRPGVVDVEVMTIHKAKGLEFDIVLLPGLERAPARETPGMMAWSETATGAGTRLLLAPLPPPEGEAHSPLHAFVRRVERDKRRLETARLLYVACTRARSRLHLFANVGWQEQQEVPAPPRVDSLLWHLWPVVCRHCERLEAAADDATGGAPRGAPAILRLPAGWSAPLLPPSLPAVAFAAEDVGTLEFSWAGQTARLVGIVAHRMLRRISEQGPQAWDAARLGDAASQVRDALQALGVPRDEADQAFAAAMDAINRTLADPRGRWLLDANHGSARSEYALTGLVDGTLVSAVLDRTFVDAAGVRWIVDYKTGSHEGGAVEEFLGREQERYRSQLERYAVLMNALDPRPTRLALYFPAMSAWQEWSWQAVR